MDEALVSKVKQLLAEGEMTQQEIADLVGYSRSTISDIATGRIHKDIEPQLLPVRLAAGQRKNLNLEQQNLSLIGEVQNLRMERNLLRRQLNAASKRGSVVESLVEELSPIIQPIPALPRVPVRRNSDRVINETLVMLLSDFHGDQIVTPEEVDGLEEYNFPIAVRRAEVLVEDTLKFTQETLRNFRFQKLVLMGLGDYTSGEIHGHVQRSYFRDQFKNDLAIAEIFAQMITELSAHFQEVEVINIIGNHGRITEKIEYTKEAVAANHDTLIMRVAEIHCKALKNVTFTFPAGLSHIHDIEGYNFYLQHGHGKKGGSETWARAKRKSQTIVPLHRGEVDYFVSGHFHTPGLVAVSGGATLIGNGAFLATDQYAYGSIEESNEPTQLIFGVHRDRGITWRLPIQLRTDGEAAGPQRYNSSFLEQMK